MIITELTDSTPYVYQSGLRTKIQGEVLPLIPTAQVNDYCSNECCYVEDVFAKPSGEWWQNDKNSFIYRKLISSDSITIELFKDGENIETITDNTLGIYINSYSLQPLYTSFVIDWEKVYNNYGSGMYQIKTTVSIIGVNNVIESQMFNLRYYSDEAANNSVRLEVKQNGNIVNSQFDFTDLNWVWYYRIKGKLTKAAPELEQDNYIASDYTVKQIQDEVKRVWNLETQLLTGSISNLLTEDNVLGNEFLITDYNLNSTEVYRNISLIPTSIELNEKGKYNQINITFKDKISNFVKRNF
jgi:hypothetical protein